MSTIRSNVLGLLENYEFLLLRIVGDARKLP